MTGVHLWRQVGKSAGFAGKYSVLRDVRSNVLKRIVSGQSTLGQVTTHKVGEMDVALGIEQDVVGLDIAMHYALAVYVAQRAANLGDPETNGILGKRLSCNVKSQVTTIHKIHH